MTDKHAENNNPEKKDPETASNSSPPLKPLEWTVENEMIMVEWCDIAQCYKWLNTRAHQKYSKMHAWFTIPAITLSTITGTASFAQTSLPLEYQGFAPMVIGTINIAIGILTTVQQYLKISELNESHRVAAISWDKFARNIRIELAKAPHERLDCANFLKMNRQEFDRLMETSPSIPIKIVEEFNKTFSGKPGSEARKRYDELKKPDICDIIVSARENLYDRSKDILENLSTCDNDIINSELMDREAIIQRKLDEIKRREQAEQKRKEDEIKLQSQKEDMKKEFARKAFEVAQQMKDKQKKIVDYVETFQRIYDRKPTTDEIEENFKDDLEVEVVQAFLATYGGSDLIV
jgi:hypothetical protein